MESAKEKPVHYPHCFSIKVTAETFEKIKTIKGHDRDLIVAIRSAIESVVDAKWADTKAPAPQAE